MLLFPLMFILHYVMYMHPSSGTGFTLALDNNNNNNNNMYSHSWTFLSFPFPLHCRFYLHSFWDFAGSFGFLCVSADILSNSGQVEALLEIKSALLL